MQLSHSNSARGMRGAHIGLALQGGGSYAAFTAGVLKALFNRRRALLTPQQVHSISGTSGGALNAALLGLGLHQGHEDPVTHVGRLWELNRLERLVKERYGYLHLVPDAVLGAMLGMSREWLASKGSLGGALKSSAGLKGAAAELIDELAHAAAPSLPEDLDAPLLLPEPPFVTVAATELRSAMAHYFTNDTHMIRRYEQLEIARQRAIIRRLSLRSVYASMAHPAVFEPVAMGEDRYVDGYYTCNPPFVYLFREGCDEVVLVRLVQQQRDSLDLSPAGLQDRTEEIIQNSTLNLEIQAYLAMREVLLSNLGPQGEAELSLGLDKLRPAAVFHEIRLLKPGNIADQGYPFAEMVERLLGLGEEVVASRHGFAAAYRGAAAGLQVVSEVDFDSGKVRSRTVDVDRLLFGEQAVAGRTVDEEGGLMRLVRRLLD